MTVEEKIDGQEQTTSPEDTATEEVQSEPGNDEETLAETEETGPPLLKELDAANDQLLRTRAEFDNYRKRVARDTERIRKTAAAALIADLLPALDNLELALQHADGTPDGLLAGIEMVQKQFKQTLERNGLNPIAAMDEKFDPQIHEAVAHVPSSEEMKDRVLEEFQKGYTLGDQVLRPSKVVVGAGPTDTQEENDTSQKSDG